MKTPLSLLSALTAWSIAPRTAEKKALMASYSLTIRLADGESQFHFGEGPPDIGSTIKLQGRPWIIQHVEELSENHYAVTVRASRSKVSTLADWS